MFDRNRETWYSKYLIQPFKYGPARPKKEQNEI